MKNPNGPVVLLLVFITMVFLLIASHAKASCDTAFAKVGAGYKFNEQKEFVYDGQSFEFYNVSPYSARFEIGVECENLTYGIAHHSQWATGAPFNNKGEYYKTEIFIDYKFEWSL